MSDFLFADGFGNLSDGDHTVAASREILGEQWASFAQTFTIEDRGDGRKWIKGSGGNQEVNLQTGVWSSQTTISFCFRVKTSTPTSAPTLMRFMDGANTLGAIGFDSTGRLIYSRWFTVPTNTVAQTDHVLASNTDTHYEVEVKFDNAVGYVKIWVNGVLDQNVTAVDTIYAGASCDNALFWANTPGLINTWKWSDFIFHIAGSPIYDCGVFYIESDTAGTDADFTPSAGNNEDNVDEIGPDEDVTYNESDGTSGHRDSFTGAGIADVTVLSVCAMARARKTGGGVAQLMVGALHAAVEDQSAGKALASDYSTLVHFVDDCPSTGAAWSTAQVTAAEDCYEVV